MSNMNSNGMYKKLRKDPLRIDRQYTNIIFLFIFFIILLTWILLVVLAKPAEFPDQNSNSRFNDLVNKSHPIIGYFINRDARAEEFYGYFDPIEFVFWYIFFGGFLILAILFTYGFIPKFYCYISIICITIYIILQQIIATFVSVHNILREDLDTKQNKAFGESITVAAIIILNLIILLYTIIVLVCIKKAGVKAVSEILAEGIWTCLNQPFLLIFGIFILALQIGIIDAIVLTLTNFQPSLTNKTIIVFLGGYLINFIIYFAKMVIFEAIATLHWSNGKIPITTILRCVLTVARYHIGTVAFGATLILPFLQAIYVASKTKSEASNFGDLFMKLVCKIFLVFNIVDYALIQTSTHGEGFFSASKRTFHFMVKNVYLSLASVYVLNCFLSTISILSYLLCLASFDTFRKREYHIDTAMKSMFLRSDMWYSVFLLLMLPVLLIVESSIQAILLCKLEDKEDKEEVQKELPLDSTAL